MGENKKSFTFKSVKPEALTSISVSGTFYQRLNKLFIDHGMKTNDKNLTAGLKAISEKRELDDWTYNLETLLILVYGIEAAFEKEGLTNSKLVDLNSDEVKEILKGTDPDNVNK